MRKIPSLFQRHYGPGRKQVFNEVTPGCEWVLDGEGVATRKWDGTCVAIIDGTLWKRFDAKHGKTPPAAFKPAQPEADPITGHWPGWVPVGGGPEDRWHLEGLAHAAYHYGEVPDGTYELVGPKVNGNPENVSDHRLIKHGSVLLAGAPREFDLLPFYFRARVAAGYGIEGIVWHHPDGRMVKIKSSDFGIDRKAARQ
ncbi:hypothetical protein SEA_WATERFOUL_78 [Mycobacterium phage Waterfoul]|nr:hypothetical protein SEA_WATERFOUL_78 [Mycobacterium phage Waterfoul]